MNKYPFKTMNVGDCVEVDAPYCRLYPAKRKYERKYGVALRIDSFRKEGNAFDSYTITRIS